ncbi:inositol-pentakisphosphate 2-kinase [Monosporozyma servazzii]
MPTENVSKVSMVGKGNANIVVSFGDDKKVLYRLSIRYGESLEANNEYSLINWRFIQRKIVPKLGIYLCSMELVNLELTAELAQLYSSYVTINPAKPDTIISFKLPNLKPSVHFTNCIYRDHQTVLYSHSYQDSFIMEIKPKWLHNPLEYCRNCTHNKYKGRNISYCYRNLLFEKGDYLKDILSSSNISNEKLNVMIQYFCKEDNVLQKIYNEQLNTYQQVQNGNINELPLLMTLRDVTCFIRWNFSSNGEDSLLHSNVKASIIDVDLKPSEKKQHWVRMENILNSFDKKVFH